MPGPTRGWRRWHRWGGLLVALPLLVLALTGVLLNHSDALDLAQKRLPMALASVYGVEPPETVLSSDATRPPLRFAGNQLYRGTEPLGACEPPFHGAVGLEKLVVAACGKELLLLTPDARLMQRLGAGWGLPAIRGLGRSGQGVVLVTPDGPVRFDPDSLNTRPVPDGTGWQSVSPEPVTGADARAVRAQAVPAEINWERLLLDLHSGRLGGGAGVLIMDLAALVLLALATTGLVIWWRGRRPRG